MDVSLMNLKAVLKNNTGFTLVEVLASLAILSLLAAFLLSIVTTTGVWTASAGKKTAATSYAASIIEQIRGYSKFLTQLSFEDTGQMTFTDNNPEDSTLAIDFESETVNIHAPPGMKASVSISPHNEILYYTSLGSSITKTFIRNNLYEVKVQVEWEEAEISKKLEINTIISAR